MLQTIKFKVQQTETESTHLKKYVSSNVHRADELSLTSANAYC